MTFAEIMMYVWCIMVSLSLIQLEAKIKRLQAAQKNQ